ncbi:MAG: glycoside hydrolase family 3 N-terminal domain-containing protein [Microbacteriaceae bacterium]
MAATTPDERATASERPWLDTGLDLEQRVELLLAELTLPELVGQLHQIVNADPVADRELLRSGAVGSTLTASGATAGTVRDDGVQRRHLDECRAVAAQSRLGIPLLVARDVIHGHRTVYPIPLGLAATWDEPLAEACAERAAAEAAADGIDWVFAPMIDLVDDARWGRVAESLGESAALTGRMGAALVRGTQSTGRVAACAKHFVGYGLSRGGRDYATVSVGMTTLQNHHLRPFRAAVDAGCLTVMAAFSDVDGVPMHAHRALLRGVLKEDWGFDGVVVADWNGIGELVEHGVASDLRDAARQAIEAGVDVDMVSGAYAAHLVELVESGEVDPSLVEDAARRVLRLKFRLGLFEARASEEAAGAGALGLDRELARAASSSSFVLLANDGVLPLDESSSVHLTGPFAHEGEALLGTWTLDGDPADVVSPASALGARLGEPHETWHGERLRVTDGRFADLAAVASRETEVTIALVGEHPRRSGEDSSVSDLGLPAGQLETLRQLAAVSQRLVAVVFTGRPLALGPVLEIADAVVLAWHPGIEAGPALIDVLYGDAQPAGRLPMALPRSTGHVPITSAERPSGRPLPSDRDGGRGRYVDAPSAALRELGEGFGYTTFAFGPVRASADELRLDGSVRLTVSVENTGSRPGRALVPLSVRDRVAEITRPLAELADWQTVDLAPGQSREVVFDVPASAFGYVGRDGTWRVEPGDVEVTIGDGTRDGATVPLRLV